jgi:diguanylate cyclase (GGDEF)-like protein/PAS domain S-box-containing protein
MTIETHNPGTLAGRPSHTSTLGKLSHLLAAIGRQLILPAPSVPYALQRRSRLLSILLLSLIALAVFAVGASFLANPHVSPLPGAYLPVTILGLSFLATAYFLNRAGRYTLAAALTVAVSAIGVWASIVANRIDFNLNATQIPYVLLAVLLSTMLLPARVTTILAVATLAGLLLVPRLIPSLPAEAFISVFVFTSFIALLMVVSATISEYDQAEIGRQTRAHLDSEHSFHQLFAASPDAIVLIDPHHPLVPWGIVDCNEVACRMNGYTRDEMLGQSIDLLNEAPGAPAERAAYLAKLKAAGTVHLEAIHKHKDGHLFTVEISTSIIAVGDRELILGIDRDITERKQAELALQDANAKLTLWLGELEQRTREITLHNDMSEMLQSCVSSAEAYAVITQIGRQLFSDEIGMLFMQSASRTMVERVALWGTASDGSPGMAVFAPDDCWALRRGRLYVGGPESAALQCRHLAGTNPFEYLCVPMAAHDGSVSLLHLQRTSGGPIPDARRRLAQTVADSISLALANLHLRETLRSQSVRDALTGLFNRRYLEETLDREVRRVTRANKPLGVIMLDIDHFKVFNDTFGHEAGDAVLREFGRFLGSNLRGEDIACRYGGEEFVLILPEADLEITTQRAEKLREGVKYLTVTDHDQSLGAISLSLGVAIYPEHGANGDALLRAADTALYRAKHNQRDRVVVSE